MSRFVLTFFLVSHFPFEPLFNRRAEDSIYEYASDDVASKNSETLLVKVKDIKLP